MNNYDFLTRYYKRQHTIMFDDIADLGFSLVVYSKGDSSFFWNNALVNEKISDEQLEEVEEKLKSYKRKPALYFENRGTLNPLKKFLEKRGYKKGAEDSWQFWANGQIDKKHFESVKKVNTKEKLREFLDTFDKCYQSGDPQNPYGELGEYLKVAEKVWHRHSRTNRLEYFLVYKGSKPVSVSTLTNHLGVGYVSNVGSLKNVRGEGYGKAATLYCVVRSKIRGNNQHCLATEEGEYPNEFYRRVGFATRFTAVVYTK